MLTYKFFTTERCHRCPAVKDFLQAREDVTGEIIDAGQAEGLEAARELGVQQVPTVVFFEGDKEVNRAYNVEEAEAILK